MAIFAPVESLPSPATLLLVFTHGGASSRLHSLQHFSIEIKTRSAARTETAGDSEELLARVVDPTSSSYFLPVAGEVTTQIKCRKFHMILFYKF